MSSAEVKKSEGEPAGVLQGGLLEEVGFEQV